MTKPGNKYHNFKRIMKHKMYLEPHREFVPQTGKHLLKLFTKIDGVAPRDQNYHAHGKKGKILLLQKLSYITKKKISIHQEILERHQPLR